ncbi:MAG: hypothetical protein GFH27_549287n265 [Chloroflexi bacterium AL-W]|nr:hypothetical protein [Chloroflexi bacterium AL-N1]NOK66539.1 hypothetical protein [Chloroflexi bacterium AL-N10]NOK71927.1 hypothetical protein [Chloroflexi bacterium AL-N5]NOK81184.1 hypothetical protein [Chloroflexi bacterium AL-W]NOK89457.1 hypothetical protein [Chloroflexi bacterium AL-N15]
MQFKLFVGNLPRHVGDTELEKIFDGLGEIQSARVITDQDTGISRGYGFVEMQGNDMATVISELNGREVGGQELRVNEAYERRNGSNRGRSRATNVHHERSSFGSPYREGRSMSDPHRNQPKRSSFGSPYREGRDPKDPHRNQPKRSSFGSPFREGRDPKDPHRDQPKRSSFGSPFREGRDPKDPHRNQPKRNSLGSPFREGRSMSDPYGKRSNSGNSNPNRKRGPRDRY